MRIVDQSETDEVVVTFVETDTEFYVHWLAKPGQRGSTGDCTGAMVFRSIQISDPLFADIHNHVMEAACQKAAAIDSPVPAERAASENGVQR